MSDEFLNIFLEESSDFLDQWEDACLALFDQYDQDSVDKLFRAIHTIKGSAKSVALNDFANYIHKVEDCIVALREDSSKFFNDFSPLLMEVHSHTSTYLKECSSLSDAPPDELKSAVETFSVKCQAAGIGAQQAPEKQVQGKKNDESVPGLTLFADEPPKANTGFTLFEDEESNSSQNSQPPQPAPKSQAKQTNSPKAEAKKFIRVSEQLLDLLLSRISELTSLKEKLKLALRENSDVKILEQLSVDIATNVEAVQDVSLTMKKTSVEPLFRFLKKSALDAARILGKNISISSSGEQELIDKTQLEALKGPLMHIIRNSVDHGIEEDRSAANKTATGEITLKAYTEGRSFSIEIADDGGGIDTNRLLSKAIENGHADQGRSYSKKEILNFIFVPSLSTKDQASEISGRGVGMDVVNRSIQELKGSVELESHLGKGSTFTVNLPTNSSIVEAFLVKIGDKIYGVDSQSIKDISYPDQAELKKINHQQTVINYHESIVPVIRPTKTLNIISPPTEEKYSYLHIMSQNSEFAIQVDKILDQQQLIVNEVSSSLANIKWINGYATDASGHPRVILNLNKLVEHESNYDNLQ